MTERTFQPSRWRLISRPSTVCMMALRRSVWPRACGYLPACLANAAIHFTAPFTTYAPVYRMGADVRVRFKYAQMYNTKQLRMAQIHTYGSIVIFKVLIQAFSIRTVDESDAGRPDLTAGQSTPRMCTCWPMSIKSHFVVNLIGLCLVSYKFIHQFLEDCMIMHLAAGKL